MAHAVSVLLQVCSPPNYSSCGSKGSPPATPIAEVNKRIILYALHVYIYIRITISFSPSLERKKTPAYFFPDLRYSDRVWIFNNRNTLIIQRPCQRGRRADRHDRVRFRRRNSQTPAPTPVAYLPRRRAPHLHRVLRRNPVKLKSRCEFPH